MPWVRFDDVFPINRKVDGLSDAAFRLHVSAIFWCARNLTDGFVPEGDLELVSARVRTPTRFAAELVDRGLWIEHETGWQIKDYLDFQPSKEQVLEDRKKAAERQRKWRDAKRNTVSNGSSNGVSNAAPPRPAPIPKGERGGGRDSKTSPVDDCDHCDQNGWHELPNGSVTRCFHPRSVTA